MRNPAEILGDHLSGPSSRRGFLATLGKFALVGGGALAALGAKDVYAACGAYPCAVNGQYYCPSNQGETDLYVGCCKSGSLYFETRVCRNAQGIVNCYYSFETQINCPNAPAR